MAHDIIFDDGLFSIERFSDGEIAFSLTSGEYYHDLEELVCVVVTLLALGYLDMVEGKLRVTAASSSRL